MRVRVRVRVGVWVRVWVRVRVRVRVRVEEALACDRALVLHAVHLARVSVRVRVKG